MQPRALSPMSGARALQLQQRRATLAALGGTEENDDGHGQSTVPTSRRGSRVVSPEVLKNDLLLHEAVIKNDYEAVKAILKEPVDVNCRNNYGRAPLHWAASRGATDIMELLRDAGCDIEAEDKYGMRPLLMAAWHGHKEALEMLLVQGASTKAKTKCTFSKLGGFNIFIADNPLIGGDLDESKAISCVLKLESFELNLPD